LDQHSEPTDSTPAEQEKFFKIISKAQGGRMDEQRCSLQPGQKNTQGAEADAFFKILASSQARRLDDQRVSLPTLPGINLPLNPKWLMQHMAPPVSCQNLLRLRLKQNIRRI
uniref:Purkinje cell protein 2 n=1 Tax=Seriola lalandi dorsalis TaxID=1841481 RepID=A0A3B4WCZ5_SERLL